MNEQEHKAMVDKWIAEAGDKPTAFGKAVGYVCWVRGTDPEWLEMTPEHEDALRDHCDGVENAPRPDDLAKAVADAIGLDWRNAPEADREDLMILAMGWTYKELWFKEPSRG